MISPACRTSLLGACVFLGVTSLILWCAAVASWAPFASNGYDVRSCKILNKTLVSCGTSGVGALFFVSYNASSAPLLAIDTPYAFTSTLNATNLVLASYPIGSVVPCYGPSSALQASSVSSFTCTIISGLFYPSSGMIFLNVASAQYSVSMWLGVWITFLVLFCIMCPLVIIFTLQMVSANVESQRRASEEAK